MFVIFARDVSSNMATCSFRCGSNFLIFFIQAPLRNFDVVSIVVLRVNKSGTAFCRKDLV